MKLGLLHLLRAALAELRAWRKRREEERIVRMIKRIRNAKVGRGRTR